MTGSGRGPYASGETERDANGNVRRDFREIQRAFAAHLRNPLAAPAPENIEARRIAIYRELFFNNVDNFLRGFFPVLHSLYSAEEWEALARAFYAGHRAETPYFLRIAEEFLDWLEKTHALRDCDPPWMRELAHYEWLELAVDSAEEHFPETGDESGIDPQGDLLEGVPVPSPLAVLGHYTWPVHRVSAIVRDVEPADTFLMVCRDRTDVVRFVEVNAIAARLFVLIHDDAQSSAAARTGRELAMQIAAEAGQPGAAAFIEGAGQTLQNWRERDIVPGTRRR